MSDNEFQNLINAMSGNVAVIDEKGEILHVNKAWDKFSEQNSGDDKFTSKGANYFTAIDTAADNYDEVTLQVQSAFQKILSGEMTNFEVEYPCHSETEERWFIANISEIGTYSPRLLLCTHKDISALVFRESRVVAAQRLEAVGQLSAGIAHDFNNLLGVVMGNLELVQLKLSDESPINDFLDRCLTAITRGASLTHKLLSFARQQELNLESIDVSPFIESTFELMSALLGEDIIIITDFNESPLVIEVDGSLLSAAILNIAINARHAMPDGGELRIRVFPEELKGQTFLSSNKKVFGTYAVIAITDTGTGIKEDDLYQIFEPFFTTKKRGQGSGLGLSMVFSFIEQSMGFIDINSQVGEGATVSLYLPLEKDALHIEKLAVHTRIKSSGNKTILIVEDSQDFLDTITQMLSSQGYDVMQATNAVEALDILKNDANNIDILLSDIVLPLPINGIKLAKKSKLSYPSIKTILMSGYPNQDLVEDDLSDLPSILEKPFTMGELITAIQELEKQD